MIDLTAAQNCRGPDGSAVSMKKSVTDGLLWQTIGGVKRQCDHVTPPSAVGVKPTISTKDPPTVCSWMTVVL